MGDVTLVRAAAGSGKTYDICNEVADRIASGDVTPDQILATTFTRKAAAELKARIQKRLLDPEANSGRSVRQRVEASEGIERALIGTVHSIGSHLVRRYALRLGHSPDLRPIEEESEQRHLRNLLAELDDDTWTRLERVAYRLGENRVQGLVKDLLEHKRTNRIGRDEFAQQIAQSRDRLLDLLAPGGPDADGPGFDDLYQEAQTALDEVLRIPDETKTTADAIDDIRNVLRARRHQWRDFNDLANVDAGKRSGAHAQLEPLQNLATRVRDHPRLHADVTEFYDLLADQVLELEHTYTNYKRARGLVDFGDLETSFLELLEDDGIAEDLARTVRLVVVDEFQDTNPIQLAIFQRLADLADQTIWVGDPKQSIYGFRGTDAKLMDDAMAAIPDDHRRHLPQNWRSARGLVDLFNRLFTPLFGPEAHQEYGDNDPPAGRIERWRLAGSKKAQRVQALAHGLHALPQEDVPYGDVAVLVRTNRDARELGEALERRHVPVVVGVPGLFRTREGRTVLAGLRLVADRNDSLAAAEILHIDADPDPETTPTWLARRLDEDKEDNIPFADDPRLAPLDDIDPLATTPAGVVAQVVQRLNVPDTTAAWGAAARRNANLDEILRLALRYEEDVHQQAQAPTVTGLISFFEDLLSEEEDTLPVPAGVDAVTVHTYHGAKGLQWPVVVLPFEGRSRQPDPFEAVVEGGDAAHQRPLDGRTIRYWQWPFGRVYMGGRTGDGTGLQEQAKATPEYQRQTDREDEENRRLLYVAFTRAQRRLILTTGPKPPKHIAERLPNLDTLLDPGLDEGEHALEGIAAPYVVRDIDAADAETEPTARQRWLAPTQTTAEPALRYHSPSDAALVADVLLTSHALPGGAALRTVRPDDWAAFGEAVHTFLSGMPSARDPETRADMARDALARWGMDGVVDPADLVAAGRRLEAWVEDRWPGAEWRTETPVTAPRADGGQWTGTIDLLLRVADGQAVLIDHKSVPMGESGWEEKATEFTGQLRAYQQALESTGLSIVGAYVHFPLGGGLVEIDPSKTTP